MSAHKRWLSPAIGKDFTGGAGRRRAGWLALCSCAGLAVAGAGSWPLFRGSPDMRGVAEEALPGELEFAWATEVGRSVMATPVVADGRVYVGAEDGKFACLDLATGEKRWEYLADDAIQGTAAIVGDLVCFGSGDGIVHALERASGAKKWTYETDGEIAGGANLFHSGDGATYVLIGSYDNHLHCIHAADGSPKWKYETENYVNGAPGVHAGRIYFGGCDAQIYGVDAETGATVSKMDVEHYIANSIVVVDGIAYVAHHGNRVAAFDLAEKKQLWEFGEREFPYVASPAVTAEAVFVAGKDKRLYRLDRESGEADWEFVTGNGIESSPVVAGGVVYVGSGDGSLYAVDAESGEERWSYEIGEDLRSSPAVADGHLVIGCDDGSVYAFKVPE